MGPGVNDSAHIQEESPVPNNQVHLTPKVFTITGGRKKFYIFFFLSARNLLKLLQDVTVIQNQLVFLNCLQREFITLFIPPVVFKSTFTQTDFQVMETLYRKSTNTSSNITKQSEMHQRRFTICKEGPKVLTVSKHVTSKMSREFLKS